MKTTIKNFAIAAMCRGRWNAHIVAVLAGFAFGGHATGQDFVIGPHAARPGSTVRVPVVIPDATGIASAAITINYDPEILALEGVTNGSLGSAFLLEHQSEEGRVKVAAVRDEALVSGGGVLVFLCFRVNPGALPGLSSALAIADRGVGSRYGRDLAWSRPVTVANGVVNVVSADLDSDSDGLPDWWEESFFGSPTGAVPAADPDGDGLTTLQEYIAATDPLDPASGLHIELQWQAGGSRLRFATVEGRLYRIERSDNLTTWDPIPPGIEGTGAPVEVVDLTAPGSRSRFYRLVVGR